MSARFRLVWFLTFGVFIFTLIRIGDTLPTSLAVFMAYCLGGLVVLVTYVPNLRCYEKLETVKEQHENSGRPLGI